MASTVKDPALAAVTALLVGGALLAQRILEYLVSFVTMLAYGQFQPYWFAIAQALLGILPVAVGFFLSLWLIAPITRELRLSQVIVRALIATAVGCAVLFVVLIVVGIVTAFSWDGAIFGQAFPTTRFDGGGALGGIARALGSALNSFASTLPLGLLAGVLLWVWQRDRAPRHPAPGIADGV